MFYPPNDIFMPGIVIGAIVYGIVALAAVSLGFTLWLFLPAIILLALGFFIIYPSYKAYEADKRTESK